MSAYDDIVADLEGLQLWELEDLLAHCVEDRDELFHLAPTSKNARSSALRVKLLRRAVQNVRDATFPAEVQP